MDELNTTRSKEGPDPPQSTTGNGERMQWRKIIDQVTSLPESPEPLSSCVVKNRKPGRSGKQGSRHREMSSDSVIYYTGKLLKRCLNTQLLPFQLWNGETADNFMAVLGIQWEDASESEHSEEHTLRHTLRPQLRNSDQLFDWGLNYPRRRGGMKTDIKLDESASW